MNECTIAAKLLIEKQVSERRILPRGAFLEFDKVYSFTNENINAYLNLVNIIGKSNALSVMASGDHAFNLICSGIKNVDTFDVNRLTEYYALGLKRTLILKYGYEDFIKIVKLFKGSDKSNLVLDVISDALPYMDEEYRKFWQDILDFNFRIQNLYGTNINLIEMLCINTLFTQKIQNYNLYLKNQESYERLRNSLGTANITFKQANALSLATDFSHSYDFILLSNILDYAYKTFGKGWNYEKLQEYIKSIEGLSHNGSVIFLNYLFNHPLGIRKNRLFMGANIQAEDLLDEEVIYFDDLNTEGSVLKRVVK